MNNIQLFCSFKIKININVCKLKKSEKETSPKLDMITPLDHYCSALEARSN
jgi:hypothetical protein